KYLWMDLSPEPAVDTKSFFLLLFQTLCIRREGFQTVFRFSSNVHPVLASRLLRYGHLHHHRRRSHHNHHQVVDRVSLMVFQTGLGLLFVSFFLEMCEKKKENR